MFPRANVCRVLSTDRIYPYVYPYVSDARARAREMKNRVKRKMILLVQSDLLLYVTTRATRVFTWNTDIRAHYEFAANR